MPSDVDRPATSRPLPPHLHPRGRRAPGRREPRWVRACRSAAAVLSCTVLLGSGYAWASYQHFTSGLTRVDAVPGVAPGRTDVDGAAQNILLVGDDHRPAGASPQELALLSTGQDGGGTNTDTMMLLHLPAGGGAPTVVSLPRDSWVAIPGHGRGKLNSAFALGAAGGGGDAAGMRLLISTIQDLTGLTVDHFVRVSLLGFYDIADVLGPIQVCLAQPAHDSYSGTDLPAGVSTLDAKQALSFVRQRHGLPRGDLDREVRQQYFLSAELHKILSAGTLLDPARTQALLGAVSSALETDPGLDLLSLAGQVQGLSADQVRFTTIPVTGTPTITDDAGDRISVVSVDPAAVQAFAEQVVAPPSATPAPSAAPTTAAPAPAAVAPGDVTVQVVNGTGRSGLAATETAALRAAGFRTEVPVDGPASPVTVVRYPAGLEAQASAVAAHLPGAALRVGSGAPVVTVDLGTDGVRVAAATAEAPAATSAAPSSPRQFTTSSCID